MAGLLDLFQPATPDPLGRVLGASYDAEDQRWEGAMQGLKAASQALLNPRQGGGGGWARAIGDIGGAMGAAGTAYKEGKTDYLYTAAKNEIAKREIERKKRLEDQEIAQDQAWADFAANLTPEQQKMVQGNPELAKAVGAQWAQSQFASDTKPSALLQGYNRAVEQGYKGDIVQYQQEIRGNGIIIENKDGTRTIIGGSGKGGGETESTRRAKLLSAQMAPSVENLKTTYNSLTEPRNYAGNFTRSVGGRFMMTPEGQQAADSISSVVAAFGYLRSGQALTAQEVRQGTEELTPYPSDDQATKDLKWARLKIMYEASQAMAGNQPKITGEDTGVNPPGDSWIWDAKTGRYVKKAQ